MRGVESILTGDGSQDDLYKDAAETYGFFARAARHALMKLIQIDAGTLFRIFIFNCGAVSSGTMHVAP
jgi:hypothetical protein